MTPSEFSLVGSPVELALIAFMIALLAAAFVIGRLNGLKWREKEEGSIEAWRREREQEETRIENLRQEKEGILKAALQAEEARTRWETVKHDHEQLEKMRRELEDFEREESKRIDELERRRAEATQRLRDVQSALDRYPDEIISDVETWSGEIAKRKEELDQLHNDAENAKREYEKVDARRTQAEDEVMRLEKKKSRFKDEIKEKKRLLEKTKQDHDQLDAMRQEFDDFKREESNQIDELNQRRIEAERHLSEIQSALGRYPNEIVSDENTWNEEVAKRKEELDQLHNDAENAKREYEKVDARRTHAEDEVARLEIRKSKLEEIKQDKKNDEKLDAFRIRPVCLEDFENVGAEIGEEELLNDFERSLDDLGLQYSKRIIRAFHTSLKVNDLSPLTVLSGLSGTGKSQLPRAYARFFGIHFLHVPVEPGWDSPQDLLGFYDFVAERYRPTDRARALGHFDSRFAIEVKIKNPDEWKKRMLIILLDEMNLARTEYYFSEFLSRLEMRGPRTKKSDGDRSGDAQIAIDLPYGKDERPKHLYVPHNVLWVGTLNEDETTQALSDKVLDRANSIQFAPPAPNSLSSHANAPKAAIELADGYLPYKRWFEWSDRRTTVEMGVEQVDKTLRTLARQMQSANRGFGYRIAQSIKVYIERYPGEDWTIPMIDQINMRLLPKLSGVEMNKCSDTIRDLRRLCEDELGDVKFANALERAAQDSEASQIFSWPGYTYEDDD